MAVKIILKNSSREDKRPTPAQISDSGELALNYNAAGAFLTCRDSNGNIQQVGGVKLASNPPADPVLGTFWLATNSDLLYVYDGTKWRSAVGSQIVYTDDVLTTDGLRRIAPPTLPSDWTLLANQREVNWWIKAKLDELETVDWSQFPTCNTSLVWDAVNECWTAVGGGSGGGFVGCGNDFTFDSVNDCWSINWSQLPNCTSLVYDTTNKCWAVKWDTFPGGDHIEWDPVAKEWNVIPVPPVEISDTAPAVKAEYFWWNSTTGELFVGYEDPSGDEYWVSASKPGEPGADGKDGDPVVISQDTPPPVTEDYIWFNTATGEAFFGYVDPSGDAYWVALSKPGKPGADGKDGDPVVISQDTPPPVTEDYIWFNTSSGEAFFGYVDPSGDAYWVALSKPGAPGADGADGIPVVISQDTPPPVTEDYIWFDTSKGEAFFGYVDPSGDGYWVSLSKPGPPGSDGLDGVTATVSATAPVNPVDGQIWHNSDIGKSYAYWSSQSVWVSM